MAGTLEPVPKGFITPERQIRGYIKPASTVYSEARSVKTSPPPSSREEVAKAAEIQSLQEKFGSDMLNAKKGGKSRRRKSKKSKKTKRRHQKKRY